MEGTRKRWRDEVEGDLNVGPNGGESRQAVRRGRRGMEGDFMGGKVQNRRTTTFEMMEQEDGEQEDGEQEEGEQEEGNRRRGAGE
jgi:hypothetical protein